jgi:two-component system nitrate/nitrite sensor histidine kinase NarX
MGSRHEGVAVSLQPRSRLVDRRLRAIGILLPVAFAIILEVVRWQLELRGVWSSGVFEVWRVAGLAVVVVGIVTFAVFMFRLIDASDRQVLRQNRDLTAANAVAGAIQGQATVGAIVDNALQAMLLTSGALQARIRFLESAGLPQGDTQPRTVALGGRHLDAGPPTLEVPLAHGSKVVGQLALWYPDETDVTDRIGGAALSSLTTHVACAVQLAGAVGDLERRKVEGHAFYDILLRVSNQEATTPVLDAVVRHAAGLLAADAAVVTVSPETSQSIRFEPGPEVPTRRADGATVVAFGLPTPAPSEEVEESPAGGTATGDPAPVDEPEWAHTASQTVSGVAGHLGELWVARTGGADFTGRDRGFLATLASLAGIALTSAQMREGVRQRAVLNERTRIAREMHDSLAQVLGAVHLRLRALETGVGTLDDEQVVAEVEALADVCAEAYRDVREAILGLRDANRHAERGLEDNLRAYLEAYSTQNGISARFANEVGHEVSLSPRAEVHVIRIVQEALTNVRKHARARSVLVSIRGTETSTSFVVADDGIGFDPEAATGSQEGYGLFTMRDRAALLGGTVQVDSAPGRGTTVAASVPERPHPSLPSRRSA